MFRIASLLIGYCLGLIQAAYIVGKLSGVDIREHGSKNAGFTNANRVLGAKKGIIVFLIDVAKAVAAYFIATIVAYHFFGYSGGGTFFANQYVMPGLYGALGAILGHTFPFYMKFKGGKGVSCMLGLVIMLDWRIMAIAFLLGLIAVVITRFISVGSLTVAICIPILMVVFGYAIEGILLTSALFAFVCFLHRLNIKRLIAGQENKFSFSKKGTL